MKNELKTYGAFARTSTGNFVCCATTEAANREDAAKALGRFASVVLSGKRANLLELTAADLATRPIRLTPAALAKRIVEGL